jgi:hypothetical protein
VFDRADRHTVIIAKGGAHVGIDHPLPGCRNKSAAAGNIGALEDNATAGFTRPEHHRNLNAGMKSDPGAAYGIFQGPLLGGTD